MGFRLNGNYREDFENRLKAMDEALDNPGIKGFEVYSLDGVREDFDKTLALDFISSLKTEQLTLGISKLSIGSSGYSLGRKKRIKSPKGTGSPSGLAKSLSFMDED
jgi:hypothetical protein